MFSFICLLIVISRDNNSRWLRVDCNSLLLCRGTRNHLLNGNDRLSIYLDSQQWTLANPQRELESVVNQTQTYPVRKDTHIRRWYYNIYLLFITSCSKTIISLWERDAALHIVEHCFPLIPPYLRFAYLSTSIPQHLFTGFWVLPVAKA